jgi:hypothetical protein
VDFDKEAVHRQDIIGYPKARLILEGQAYLMGFLRKTVEGILDGLDLDNLQPSSEKWLVLSAAGMKHATEETTYCSIYANQAFSSPPRFDAAVLISICEVRMNAVGDHLSFLQTDPAYMRRWVRVLQEGHVFQLASSDSKGGSIFCSLMKEIVGFWWWKWVKSECEYVHSLQVRFRDSIHQGQRLPIVYDKALGALELLLVNQVIGRGKELAGEFPQRPGFRDKYVFTPTEQPGAWKVTPKGDETTIEVYTGKPLVWCLHQLTGEPDRQQNFDHGMLYAFLEDFLNTAPYEEKKRIDEQVLGPVSDLAAYYEMLAAVRLHRPQNHFSITSEVMDGEDREAWRAKEVLRRPMPFSSPEMRRVGSALFKEINYAQPPTKSLERMQQTKATRATIEKFWREIRTMMGSLLKGSRFDDEYVSSLLQIISANLDPAYIETVQLEEERILTALHALTLKPIPSQEATAQTEWGTSHIGEKNNAISTKTKTKIKIKTRALGREPLPEAPQIEEAAPEDEKKQQKLPATKRALKIFRQMFAVDAEDAAKGIDWATFVRAMSDVGFVVREAGGSAVAFEKDDGKIVFHKPHPETEIDSIMLHIMGKRMTKWFGWSRELFVSDA